MTATKYDAKYDAGATGVTKRGRPTTAKYDATNQAPAMEVTKRDRTTIKYNAIATDALATERNRVRDSGGTTRGRKSTRKTTTKYDAK